MARKDSIIDGLDAEIKTIRSHGQLDSAETEEAKLNGAVRGIGDRSASALHVGKARRGRLHGCF